MQKVGRNKPCPCGSGKKYKSCCWHKDQAEARRQREEEAKVPIYVGEEWDDDMEWDDDLEQDLLESHLEFGSTEADDEAESEPDPLMEAMNEFWDAFVDAQGAEKWQLAEVTLNERPELFDKEMAFEVFSNLNEDTAVSENRDRFAALVDLLQQQAPESYEYEAHYLLSWRIEHALTNGDYEAISSLFNDISLLAGDEIDEFNRVEQKLAYHGLLDTLLTGHRLGWPLVQDSDKIVPWGIDEFINRAADYETYALLQKSPTLAADDPVLLEKIDPYITPDIDRFSAYIAYLTGQKQPEWTLDDFILAPPPKRREDSWFDEEDEDEEEVINPARENYFYLSVAFVHYLHHEEGVSYTKARLIRSHLLRYFFERHAGELESVDNPLLALRYPKKKRRKKTKRHQQHPLCPDKKTLDRYVMRLIGFMSSRYHVAGTLIELIPAWLRFLEKHQLLDAPQQKKTLQRIQPIATSWSKYVDDLNIDPLLTANAKKWRKNAGLA